MKPHLDHLVFHQKEMDPLSFAKFMCQNGKNKFGPGSSGNEDSQIENDSSFVATRTSLFIHEALTVKMELDDEEIAEVESLSKVSLVYRFNGLWP